MTGKEIIDGLIREEIPTAEEIRSHAFVHGEIKKYRPLRLVKAAIALVALLVFSTAVYAVGTHIYRQRLDVGGQWEYVVVPFDSPEYQAQRANVIFLAPLYFSPNHHNIQRIRITPDQAAWFDREQVQQIRDMLAGKIFTADGAPFDLMVRAPLSTQYMPYQGNVLYDAYGNEISEIYLFLSISPDEQREITDLHILTFNGDTCDTWDGTVGGIGAIQRSLDEAANLLGRGLNRPTIHMENFEEPTFEFGVTAVGDWCYEINQFVVLQKGVWATFQGRERHGDLTIIMEPIRTENVTPREIMLADGEITVFDEVAGVTVYEVSARHRSSHFVWTHDGVVYIFYRPRYNADPPIFERVSEEIVDGMRHYIYEYVNQYAFTDDEIREIIRSMIEQD